MGGKINVNIFLVGKHEPKSLERIGGPQDSINVDSERSWIVDQIHPPQNKEHWQIVANTFDILYEEENF